MLTGFQFYRKYAPLHLHFSSAYDIFKYNGKFKSLTEETFSARKDHNLFTKIGKKINNDREAGQLCLANHILTQDNNWLYNTNNEPFTNYLTWKGYRQAFTKHFEEETNELRTISESIGPADRTNLIRRTKNGRLPPMLQLYVHGRISADSLVVLDHIHPFISSWITEYSVDPLIIQSLNLVVKYRPFVNITKHQPAVINFFTEN